MMRSAPCPLPELVQAASMEALPPGTQERVAAHILSCETCQGLIAALDDAEIAEPTPEERVRLRARVTASVADALVRHPRPQGIRKWFNAAAAVIVGGICTALVWQFTRSPRAPASVSVPRLEKPAPPSRAGIVWRGAGDAETQELARALEPFNADDYWESSRRLGAFVGRHPQNAHGQFYLGVTQLFLGADSAGVLALEQAQQLVRDDPGLAGQIAWYLALGYARTNQVERAVRTLDGLCRAQHVLAAQACTTLRELEPKRR